MRNLIRSGLATALAGALALGGLALAQQGTQPGGGGGGSSSGGAAGSSDTATGGGGSTAGSGSTASGAPSAAPKIDKKLQGKLEKIHADNQGEVQLAQVAQQNAQSPEVKQFAEQMATDHQRFDGKLSDVVQNMGGSLDGKDFQKAQQANAKDVAKLQSKTGKDFDKAYMGRMVKDHKKDLKEVKAATKSAQKANAPELTALLQGAQGGLQKHLDHAKQVQASLKKGGSSTSGTGSSGGGTGQSQ
jgi:putative membrane protein